MNFFTVISDWYFSQKTLPHWGVLVLDCFIVFFACIVGRYFELEGDVLVDSFASIALGALICVVLYAISFRVFRTYKGIIRYSSFVDLQRIAVSTLLGAIFSLLVWYATRDVAYISVVGPHGIFATYFIATLLMWMVRVVVKRMFDNFHMDDAIPVVIYGTKAGGISLAKSITAVKDKAYSLQAFISDGEEMKNTTLFGKKVYMNRPGIARLMRKMGIHL